jgi:hypothetical protein
MKNDLWPFGFPTEEFEEWINNCPASWIRLQVEEGSVTYKFLIENEKEEEEEETEEEDKGPWETYLLVESSTSGDKYITPIDSDTPLDLEELVKVWIDEQFWGEAKLDGEITPGLEGEFYAQIKTDWATEDSVVCWSSGGFYVCSNE